MVIDYNQMYEFHEPHITGGDCTIRLTAKQAIDYMRQTHGNRYSDEAHLDTFIAVYWAYPVGDS